jgi:hypothetical protein
LNGDVPAKFPFDFECGECGAILEALLNSFQVDLREVRHRLLETAHASGRTIEEMRDVWVSSVAASGSRRRSKTGEALEKARSLRGRNTQGGRYV